MARVLLRTQAWGVVLDDAGNALPNLSYVLKNTDGSAATHWSAETGGTSSTASLTTDADGGASLSGADRWVEAGGYDLTVNGRTYRVTTSSDFDLAVIKEAPLNVQWSAYGAKGNNVTDDGGAIRAALAAANGVTGASVFMPATSAGYKVTTQITMPQGVRLFGDGVPARFAQDPNNSPTRILYTGSGACFAYQPGAGVIIRKGSIANLYVDGIGASAGADGLLIDSTAAGSGATGLVFSDLTIARFPGFQIHEKDLGGAGCWGHDFDRVTVHDSGGSGGNDLVHWDGTTTNSTSNTWRACVFNNYTAAKWGFFGGGGHTFIGGVFQPSNGGAGGNGLWSSGGFVRVLGTWLEGALASQTATIGLRWTGSGGAFIEPSFCGLFGKGIEIGDGTSANAVGAVIGGNIGGFNAGTGNCDIHITSGGARKGTVILGTGSIAGGPTVIDDRAASDGVFEVVQMFNNQIVAPCGTAAVPAFVAHGAHDAGIFMDNGSAGDLGFSSGGVETGRVTASGRINSKRQLYPGSGVTDNTEQSAAGILGGTGVPSNGVGNNGDIYLRSDGGAGTTIYQRRAGAWVATAA